jgi:hypothetical protein
LMEGVKTWLSSQVADYFDTCIKTYSLIWQVPQFWWWLHWEAVWVCMYVLYMIQFFSSLHVLLTAHWRLLSE